MAGSISLTSFASLLKLHVQRQQHGDQVQETLKSVMEQSYLLWPDAPVSGFETLIRSLRKSPKVHADTIYMFLDNCFMRFARRTVVYTDHLDGLIYSVQAKGEEVEQRGLPDLLMIVLMEQTPHLVARQPYEAATAVAQFLRFYIDFSLLRGVNRSLLLLILDTMKKSFVEQEQCFIPLGHALQEPLDRDVQEAFNQSYQESAKEVDQVPSLATQMDVDMQPEVVIPPGPPAEDQNHRGLTEWTREDIQDAIIDGAIEKLILCLCSEYKEIRRQALGSIRSFIQKLEVSLLNVDAVPCSLFLALQIQRMATSESISRRDSRDSKRHWNRSTTALYCGCTRKPPAPSAYRSTPLPIQKGKQLSQPRTTVDSGQAPFVLDGQGLDVSTFRR